MKLNKRAQQVLAYLSGIPSLEEEVFLELGSLSKEGEKEFVRMLAVWLKLQEEEIEEIGKTLTEVVSKLKLNSIKVRERVESLEYLRLVRKSFRNWSAAESEQKRILIRNLLIQASQRFTSPDEVLLMFVDLLDNYSDEHFEVLRRIYFSLPEGLTRYELWKETNHREPPAEDSAEADMFKMLILDLTTGYLIRQPREKDYYGHFIRSKPPWAVAPQENIQSTIAFDNTKKYVLTELGQQLMLYTKEEEEKEDNLELPEP